VHSQGGIAIVKNYKDVVLKKKEVCKITCNICADEIPKNEFGYFDDYACLKKTWGYGSEFDGQVHELDFCQKCYRKIYDNLKVSPNID